MELHPSSVSLGRDPKQGLKVGVAPAGQEGWAASVFATSDGPLMLVQSHQLTYSGVYPDKGLSQELYTSPADMARYTEMELLSPLITLKAGQKLRDDAIWQLLPANTLDHADTAARAHRHALERLQRELELAR